MSKEMIAIHTVSLPSHWCFLVFRSGGAAGVMLRLNRGRCSR